MKRRRAWLGWAVAVMALDVVGACSQRFGSSAHDDAATGGSAQDATMVHDAQPVDGRALDAALDAAALDAGPREHALGMNDVSMLFQLPVDAQTGATIARMSGIPDDSGSGGVDLVPRAVFAQLATTPGDVTDAYDDFHLVALRFNLCDRVATGACAAGADGVLRLVFQPAIDTGDVPPVATTDTAIEATYPIPAADLAEVVHELRTLAQLSGFQTASPLAINQAVRSTDPPSAYRTNLRALIAHYAVASQLAELTLSVEASRFVWHFRGLTLSAGSAQVLPVATLGVAEQDTAVEDSPLGYATTPIADAPAGIATAITQAFENASLVDQHAAVGALAAVQNPTTTGFQDEQCIGCHVASFLTVSRAHDLGIDPTTIAGTFTSPRAIATTFGPGGAIEIATRGFGWYVAGPAISQRVANETAVVLDEIDLRFPAGPQ